MAFLVENKFLYRMIKKMAKKINDLLFIKNLVSLILIYVSP